MSKKDEALKLALEALETCDVVDCEQDFDHEKVDEAITAVREALADQPAQPQQEQQPVWRTGGGIPRFKRPAQQALDKMAENARELGLDYEPAQQEPVALNRDGMQKLLEQSGYDVACPEEKAAFLSGVRHREAESLDASPQPAQQQQIAESPNDWSDWKVIPPQPQPAQQQEPVAWMTQARNFVHLSEFTEEEAKLYGWKPIYTSPPQRTWVGLTDDDKKTPDMGKYVFLNDDWIDGYKTGLEKSEAKLKEKNNV